MKPLTDERSRCEHTTDPELRQFYWDHVELLEARCWLAGRPVVVRPDGARLAFRPVERGS